MSKKKRRSQRRQQTAPENSNSLYEITGDGDVTRISTSSGGTVVINSGADIVMKSGESCYVGGIQMKSNGSAVHDVVKTSAKDLIYGQILPHEITAFIPLITDLHREIGFTEAVEDPLPYIREINRELATNPYSIIYACVDNEMKPHGYFWFRIDRNPKGERFVTIEHDYIIPEHRGTLTEARIQERFIAYAVEIGERVDSKYVNTSVRSKKLMESRKKLGFVPVEMKMTFKGTAQDFKNRNPRFERYGHYNNKQEIEEENVESNA